MTHGITHLTTPPHTPKHNDYSERRHLHIVETSLTLLHQVSITITFRPYAFAMVVYLINKMTKVGISLGSAFEKLFHKAPDPSKLHVFVCLCFPWLHPYSSHKLDLKSSPCIFLSYSLTQSVFLCFDPILNKIIVSRHVKFLENVFLFASPSTSTTSMVDTDSALPASSFFLGDYPAPPTSFSSLHLSSRRTTSHPPIPFPSPDLRSSPSPYPSSRRTTSHPPIPLTSPELLNSSPSPHPSSRQATSRPSISPTSPKLPRSSPLPHPSSR